MIEIIQMVVLFCFLLIVPWLVGSVFDSNWKGTGKIAFYWVSGQLLLWAGFQLICVPIILMGKSFRVLTECYFVFIVAMLIFALGAGLRRRSRGRASFGLNLSKSKAALSEGGPIALWMLAAVLLLMQLFLIIVLAYEEGDDAYYVALSTQSLDAQKLYTVLPYTGGTSGLNARHALAPFPVFIAFLSKCFYVPPVTVAHIVLPMAIVLMAYAIFYLLGRKLLAGKYQYLPGYLVLVEVLVLFGGYSLYTTENFLLVRSAQGKAVLGNVVIPFLLLLFYSLYEALEKNEKPRLSFWILLWSAMLAGCLCSTLGAFLLCLIAGLVALCGIICYKKISFAIKLMVGTLLPLLCAGLYFFMD